MSNDATTRVICDGDALGNDGGGIALLRRAEEAKENENELEGQSGRRTRFKQWPAAPGRPWRMACAVRQPAMSVLHAAFFLYCRSEL